MTKILLMAVLAVGFSSATFAAENTSPDAENVDTACTQEAAASHCTGEKVGTRLMKCMFTYKKTHSDFKLSPGCKAAAQKMRADRAAR